ncbi:MAG: 1-acyl-sn-glycerol-3-phosphate acyltransferase [Oscillospiraceae bacterium]|nr:1-acyl-sn-glycerol-3-phosphate acyltransferase [Oscillospiraceae bacterium]
MAQLTPTEENKKKTSSGKAVGPQRNPVFFTLAYNALKLWFALSGIRVVVTKQPEQKPKGPCIVLCNHGSFVDFFFAGKLLEGVDFRFVTARLYFYHKWLAKALRMVGCFPKSMFAVDLESTKNCLRVLQSGGVLAMMPEARLSTAGRFEDIQDNTWSFLKKAGVPVYTICFRGDYFADPKWGSGFRRGAVVEGEMTRLLEPEALASMTTEEIATAVEKALYYDEFAWLETRPKQVYKSRRLAEGLANILTRCPKCGKKYTLETKGRQLRCSSCGLETRLDDRYGFAEDAPFANLSLWYDWQRKALAQEIASDPDYRLEAKVTLRHADPTGKHLTAEAGRGVCVLNRQGLTYTGTRNGEETTLHFPLRQVYRLLFGAGENFELYQGTQIFYFVPEEKRSCVDWYMASGILYDMVFPKETE